MFLKKPDARLEKGLRGFPVIALLSVFSKWYTTVLVDLLQEEKDPIEWMSLHVGAERGVNCEHTQGLMTNLLQKHWKWQENRRKDLEPGKFKYKAMYMASLDVKTAFHVAKPSVVSKILSLIGTHGHVVAALLACIRQGGVGRHQCCGSGWQSTYFGKLKKDGKPKDGDCCHYWLFCHNREILVHMVKDIIEELLNLGHGTQAGITMVDEFAQGGGQGRAPGGRRRERLGIAVQGGLRGIWVPFST